MLFVRIDFLMVMHALGLRIWVYEWFCLTEANLHIVTKVCCLINDQVILRQVNLFFFVFQGCFYRLVLTDADTLG